jgi:hypothetical protein
MCVLNVCVECVCWTCALNVCVYHVLYVSGALVFVLFVCLWVCVMHWHVCCLFVYGCVCLWNIDLCVCMLVHLNVCVCVGCIGMRVCFLFMCMCLWNSD